MGLLRHRNKTPPSDVESAAASSDTANGGEKQDRVCLAVLLFYFEFDIFGFLAYANGDEYDILLRFAADEAAKLEHGDEDGDGEEDVQYTRPWYAPWKKVKKENLKEKKVRLS